MQRPLSSRSLLSRPRSTYPYSCGVGEQEASACSGRDVLWSGMLRTRRCKWCMGCAAAAAAATAAAAAHLDGVDEDLVHLPQHVQAVALGHVANHPHRQARPCAQQIAQGTAGSQRLASRQRHGECREVAGGVKKGESSSRPARLAAWPTWYGRPARQLLLLLLPTPENVPAATRRGCQLSKRQALASLPTRPPTHPGRGGAR